MSQQAPKFEVIHTMTLDKARGILVDMADTKRRASENARRNLRRGIANPNDVAVARAAADQWEEEAWAIQRVLRALQEGDARVKELEAGNPNSAENFQAALGVKS